MLIVIDGDIESPYKIVPERYFFIKIRAFLYHSPNTTWRPPWCLLCDVIRAPPQCNTTSESPYDVIGQLFFSLM